MDIRELARKAAGRDLSDASALSAGRNWYWRIEHEAPYRDCIFCPAL